MEKYMKSNASKFQKCHAALLRLRNCFHRQPASPGVPPTVILEAPPAIPLNPLERITEHLRRLGLGQQVHVRFEAAAGDYILEDADGFLHAKDYDAAVALIERTWLYQPTDPL